MGRLTSKAVNKAIIAKYGLDVKVWVDRNASHFYSDVDEVALMLASTDNGVAVCQLNHLSLEQWLNTFGTILETLDNWKEVAFKALYNTQLKTDHPTHNLNTLEIRAELVRKYDFYYDDVMAIPVHRELAQELHFQRNGCLKLKGQGALYGKKNN